MRTLAPAEWDSGQRGRKASSDDKASKGVAPFFDKEWDWNYDDLYSANGFMPENQKTTPGLSTESPFYYMEFYNQDRTNHGNFLTFIPFHSFFQFPSISKNATCC